MKTTASVANGMTWFAPIITSQRVVKKVKNPRISSPTMRLYQYGAKHQGIYLNAPAARLLNDITYGKEVSVLLGADSKSIVLQLQPHSLGFKLRPSYHKKDKTTPKAYWIYLSADVMDKLKAIGFNPDTTLPFTFEKSVNSLVACRSI